MIELDFEKFCNQAYESDQYHQLYIMFNGEGDVLYIGIRRRNIWERWFGFGGHMIYDGGRFLGTSAIGTKIEDHLPDFLKWKIQLWTLEDCIVYCAGLLPSTRQMFSIDFIEPFMIQKLLPIMNITCNLNPGKNTTPKNKKELEREKILYRAYKKIFDRDE